MYKGHGVAVKTFPTFPKTVSKLSHLMGGDLERVNLIHFSLWLRVH